MKKIIIVLSVVLYQLNLGFSQDYSIISLDTLNRYGTNGKKTGYWVEFLKKNLKSTGNKKKAAFFQYVLFKNGERISSKIYVTSVMIPLCIEALGNKAKKDKIILLDGTYSVYVKKGSILANQFAFSKGILLIRKEFYRDGKPRSYETYKNDSILSTSYKENGEIEMKWYYILQNDKWKPIKY